MKCDIAREMIFDFLESGEIDNSLKSHLESCESCRMEFDNLKSTIDSITPSVKLEIAEGFTSRVMAQIGNKTEQVLPIRRKPSKSLFAKAIAIAATLLIAFNLPFFDLNRDDISSADKEKKEAFSLLSAAFAAESTFKSQGIMHWETRVEEKTWKNSRYTFSPVIAPEIDPELKDIYLCLNNDDADQNQIYYKQFWYDADSGYFAMLIQDWNEAPLFAACYDGKAYHILSRENGNGLFEHTIEKDTDSIYVWIENFINSGSSTGLSNNLKETFESKFNDIEKHSDNIKIVKTVNQITGENDSNITEISYLLPHNVRYNYKVREADSVIVSLDFYINDMHCISTRLLERKRLESLDDFPYQIAMLESFAGFDKPSRSFVARETLGNLMKIGSKSIDTP